MKWALTSALLILLLVVGAEDIFERRNPDSSFELEAEPTTQQQQNCGGRGHVCHGGSCRNNTCVKYTMTTADIPTITKVIHTMFNTENAKPQPHPGAVFGGFVRAAFHDSTGPSQSKCCLLVACPGHRCDRNRGENVGLERTVNLTLATYWKSGISTKISICDFFYWCTAMAVSISSGGAVAPWLKWGRPNCAGLDRMPEVNTQFTLSPSANYLGAFHPFEKFADVFENTHGFTRDEWICLVGGAHSIGGSTKGETGFTRHWSISPTKLDNQFFKTLADRSIIWTEEATSKTIANAPNPGSRQFEIHGTTPHTSVSFSHGDLVMFWNLTDTCTIGDFKNTLGKGFCLQRIDGPVGPSKGCLEFMELLGRDQNQFNSCFKRSFQKLIELHVPNLKNP
jgi:hypothetical protein